MRRPKVSVEFLIQSSFVRWAKLATFEFPALALLYAVPNGVRTSAKQAGKLKAEGLQAGVPDLHLPVARGGYHGLWLEMKAPAGRMSDDQRWWREQLLAQGHAHVVPRSVDEAKAAVLAYLGGAL